MTDVDAFLEHYGVRGQKWGVRRKRTGSPVHSTVEAKERDRILNKQRTTGLHSLSNQQIETFNRRMNLEQNYKRLSPPTSAQKGKKFLKEVLGAAIGGTSMAAVGKFATSESGKKIALGLAKRAKKATTIVKTGPLNLGL